MTIEMKMDQRYEQGRKKGRNEGEQNRDKELITKWLQKGKSIAEIAENLDRTDMLKSLCEFRCWKFRGFQVSMCLLL